MQQSDEDEILDLVDEHDRVIGEIRRDEAYKQDKHNFRVVNGFIRNSNGELWIPRRSAHKSLFPSALDVSVGGHVSSGRTYEEAFQDELAEELNLDPASTPYNEIGYFTPQEGVHCFMKVYEIRSDEAPSYNPDDFTEYFWLTPAAVLARLAGGESSKDDLPVLMKLLYLPAGNGQNA